MPTTHARHVRYIDRTRRLYLARGFDNPYRWATFDDVPFAPLAKPLAEAKVTLVTTANQADLPDWDGSGRRPRGHYAIDSTAVPERFFTDDLSWHKEVTHTDDRETFFPIETLRQLESEGRIGAIAPRLFGVPTTFSQRQTNEEDAPWILRSCLQDQVDIALLVPL